MSRKSKRELERAVDGLGGDVDDPDPFLVYEDPETGEIRDADEELVDLNEVDPIAIVPMEEEEP